MTIYLNTGLGLVFSLIHLFVALGLLSVVENTKIHKSGSFPQKPPEYEVVNPTRVDAKGHFLSNFLPHHGSRIQRRHVLEKTRSPERVFYHLLHRGNSLHFNLSLNSHFLATGFLTERRYGGLDGAKLQRHTPSLCHFLGEVWDESTGKGKAAISTCDGLTGLFTVSEEEFFIQPVERTSSVSEEPQAHLISKRHSPLNQSPAERPVSGTRQADSNSTCGVQDPHGGLEETEGQRRRWETRRSARRGRRVRQRSVTTEKWVETLVVADPKMVEYHGSQGVESYVLAVMNIVSGLFRDASIGNAIHIVVVRLILLEEEEEELKITHHADSSLSSFCKWQKGLNMKGDDHPLHHDVAVLLTRKDICTSINKPCETLGLSHVAGMCQPHRSCSINEDTGLPLAFTVAHELGHNFGIQHDGNSNDCEPIGKKPFIMSPQLLYGTLRPSWSRCSRQYITRFLDRGWGWCLDDPPLRNELSQTPMPPGLLYSAAHQCRLQYGPQSLLCDDVDNVCSTLWCTVGSTCHSKMDGAVDGTNCGEGKWCFRGECIPAGHRPEGVNGGWSSWSGWTACSRTCGVGVLSAHRDCDNPVPKYGGRYCLGERRRYRTCNKTPCFSELPSFRDLQCGHFNTMAYKGNFHKWVAVNNRDYACELHCRPLNEHFSEKMLDAVADGTRCSETNTSRDMCINGVCKNVGCDFVIDSNALEDRCGVCQGDGSTCKTVTKTFEKSEGLGYVDIGLIPEGARDIRVEEMAAAGNFLALRSDKPDTYFLNGGWTIQWNGEYKAAGTVFTYERTGHLENLTSPGPTKEPLWIQLLFQETNPGVRYEYTIRQEYSEDNTTVMSDFFWKFGSWTECSASCGAGVQRQIVHCVERTSGIVEEHFCDAIIRPDDEQTICQKEQCPPTWWAGEWQKCSSSCGLSGLTKRTVLCIQAVDLEERQALQHTECKHMAKPESVTSCNTHVPCPADWISGSWADCSLTCGTGVHQRNVTCSWNTGVACDSHRRPPVTSSCHVRDCQVVADNFGREDDWSGSGWTSNQGVNEINSIPEVGHSAPKQTPSTRAQPRAHNELDNVIEAEFPPRHHVDKGNQPIEKNVKVDDFYYDYNFINFHEDLAYDVVDTENSVTEEQESLPIQQEHVPEPTTEENIARRQPATTTSAATIETTQGHTGNIKEKQSDTPEKISLDLENIVFPEDDYFLPVSTMTARPPVPLSPTRHPHSPKEWQVRRGSPEDPSTLPGFDVNKQEPAQSETPQEEFIHSKGGLNAEEDGNTPGTLKPVTATQGYTDGSLASAEEIEDADYFEHQSSDETTIDDSQVANDNTEPPLPSTSEEIAVRFQTESAPASPEGPDKGAAEIPTAASRWFDLSATFPTAVMSQYTDYDKRLRESNSTGQANPRLTNCSFKVTAYPSSQESVTAHSISGHQETSADTLPVIETPLPPNGGPLLPALSKLTHSTWPGSTEELPTRPTLIERTAPDGSPLRTHLEPSSSYGDDNEMNVPLEIPRGKSETQPPEITPATSVSLTQAETMTLPSQGPAGSALSDLSSGSVPGPTKLPIPASNQATAAAYWVVGNWSSCSTSCGLGAIWRRLACSTGIDLDCDPAKRPAPARRCYLRPCSAWRTGEWSKCSASCGGGVTLREVQCFDMRDPRPLRPFHCQAISQRPRTHMPCNVQPCLEWYTSSWGQCSEVCGGGEQQRMVTCPEEGQCDQDLKLAHIQSCNSQPCAQWLTGSWGQCSLLCGGGVQHRLIKCVDTRAEMEDEMDQAQCEPQPMPQSTKKCNLHECESASSGVVCLGDQLTFRFCQTLHWLGRCRLPTVQAQCCRTCGQRSRGQGRTSHR
ncbi:A disintegrin and metalloproteinase with thrombospondin motifs 7 isoform X2 [Gadus morhua]|uniref:A disintegrin and metalloproteinase with thrombospondin motifs 7-like n=1 Tax=Gadus morhua TaxID=8049 RepID=A0A8C5FGU4_GADMO|nr:A disintegrin and metalloproteinase with thrombospondin motifs 7-like isoform X2 [Gadus morhua]